MTTNRSFSLTGKDLFVYDENDYPYIAKYFIFLQKCVHRIKIFPGWLKTTPDIPDTT